MKSSSSKKKKELEISLGPVEIPKADISLTGLWDLAAIAQTSRDVIIDGVYIGDCYHFLEDSHSGFYTHRVTFSRKELRRAFDIEDGKSYEEMLEILKFHEKAIIKEFLHMQKCDAGEDEMTKWEERMGEQDELERQRRAATESDQKNPN